MNIREATKQDWDTIWPIFREVVAAGETYAYETDIGKEQAEKIWLDAPRKTYIFEEDGEIFGTYYLKTNQPGPGSHVCNCGYMVASQARGRGLATSMCKHSQKIALELGYKAMQFNFVVSSNEVAVSLWGTLSFETVGRLPKAFKHPTQGYVDVLVMYKWLAGSTYSKHLEKLFSYGTLQLENVQRETFGRVLKGVKDTLTGYVLSEVKITDSEVIKKSGTDLHPILKATANRLDEVEGMIFEITQEELQQADEYEVEEYARIEAEFKSGERAWVYTDAAQIKGA